MRIAIDAICVRDYKSGFGQHIRQLVQGLSEIDLENEYIVLVNAGSEQEWPSLTDRFQILPVTVPPRLDFFWNQIHVGLWNIAKRVDLWHSPVSAPPFWSPAKTIVTINDLSFEYYPEAYTRAALLYWKKVFPATLKRASLVIAISENTRQDAIQLYGISPHKIRKIYLAAPSMLPKFETRHSSGGEDLHFLPDDYILYVGAFNPRKNIPNLIKGFQIAKREAGLQHKLVLCGSSSWNNTNLSEVISDLGVQSEVIIVGPVEDEALPLLYRQAALFVYPSLYEGFGYPPLEALAYGVPVVASNVSSLPEVLGGGALFFDPKDPSDIAKKMLQVLLQPHIAQALRQRGAERVRFFSLKRMARETLKAYKVAYES